jgi:hypothetical protein
MVGQRPLHRVGRDGKLRHSFGLAFKEVSNRLNESMTQGVLLCLADRGEVILGADFIGEILGFRRDGTVRWRRRLVDYSPIEVTPAGGGIRFNYVPEPMGFSNALASLVRMSDTIGMLQVGRLELVDGGLQRVALQSILIDLRDGQEVGRQQGIPKVLAVHGDKLLLTDDEPEPWVEVRTFRVVPMPK